MVNKEADRSEINLAAQILARYMKKYEGEIEFDVFLPDGQKEQITGTRADDGFVESIRI